MTLTQLEYVLAVNKLRHFGKAARSCFVTQPTLSMQLQKLEDELGLVIFDRSRSPILPTPEGERIIEQARAVVREASRLLALVQQHFVDKHPKVHLIIEEAKTDAIVEMLAEDEIDAGLLVTPLNDETLIERVLFYEPFSLFSAPDPPP